MDIGAVTVFAEDMEKMVAFYRDALRMGFEWDGGPFTGFRMGNGVFFNLCSRALHDPSLVDYPRGVSGTVEISFPVPTPEDVDREYDRLVRAGAKPLYPPESKPYGLRDSAVADPEGNLVEIVAVLP